MKDSAFYLIAETCVIGGLYILLSACLISFNKWLMEDRFPFAKVFTTIHMLMATLLSQLLYRLAPSLYPTMGKAKANWRAVLKFMLPLGLLFAFALYCSNKAYRYCSVAFLQFCKEANVAIMFPMSCLLGLQDFSWRKAGILSIVVAGCAICALGEMNFVMVGFLLQILSQIAECAKNLIGEVVMSGSGMKLDVLTFVAFQAPISLVPLFIFMVHSWEPRIWVALKAYWLVLLFNGLNAFALNLVIATSLKRLSAVAFVVIGVVKDGVIVVASAVIFDDPISLQQQVGFAVIVIGIILWGYLKIQERKLTEEPGLSQEQGQIELVDRAIVRESTELDCEPSPTSKALAASNDSI